MGVVIRAPLFYAMDVWFNKLTTVVRPPNSTNDGNSTMENINQTTFLSTGTQNSTIEAQEIVFNVYYLLNWPLRLIFHVSIILMIMFALSSHLKNLLPVLLSFTPLILITWSVNYMLQDSHIILHLEMYCVILIRCFMFVALCFFLLSQMRDEQRNNKWRFIPALISFYFLSAINPPDVQFQLAKYLLFAYIVPITGQPQARYRSILQTNLLFILFIIFHLAPFYLETTDESVAAWKTTFFDQGLSVMFVVIFIFVLGLFTLLVEAGVSYYLLRKMNFGKYFTWISPVYFYAFLFEKQLFSNLEVNDAWATPLQIYLVTHLLSTLINVCDVTSSALMMMMVDRERELEEIIRMKNRARMLYVFTIFSAACCLVYAGVTSITSPQMIIITIYVVFTSLWNVFYYVRRKDYPEHQQIDHAFRLPLLIFTSAHMLVQVILAFDLLMLIGAFTFALLVKIHAMNTSPYFTRVMKVAEYVDSIPKIIEEKLRALEDEDAACCICLEKMSSGCETKCEHCYHEDCLKKWLKVNDKCPICQRVLFKEDNGVNEELEEVVET